MKRTSLKITVLIFALLLSAIFICSCGETESNPLAVREMVKNLGENEIIVSFPGLGIDPFVINKDIFAIPLGAGNTIHIFAFLGAICALAYAYFRARRNEKIKTGDFLDVALWSIMIGIIGGRLLYVLCLPEKYKDFWSAFNVWDGGSSILGALIFGGISVFVICKMQKLKFLKVADLAASGVMLGQIVGRLDNFVCGESYGYAVAEGSALDFIKMGIYPYAGENASKYELTTVHPTFLYEMVWNLIGFVIINIFYRKKKYDGQIFYFYMAWYGFGRMFIEMLRMDSLQVGAIRISMIIACLLFVFGVMLMIVGSDRGKRERAANESYEKVYTNFNTGNPITSKYQTKENKEENNNSEEDNEDEDN